jgi:hypothetical protein
MKPVLTPAELCLRLKILRERVLQPGDAELYADEKRGVLWFQRDQSLMSVAWNKTNPRLEGVFHGTVLNLHVRFPLPAITHAADFGIDQIHVKAFDLIDRQIPVSELLERFEEKWGRKEGIAE